MSAVVNLKVPTTAGMSSCSTFALGGTGEGGLLDEATVEVDGVLPAAAALGGGG